jgi:hypothetical protein
MEEPMNALSKRQRITKKDLLSKEVPRLERALGTPSDADYALSVMRRIRFIIGTLKSLPMDHQDEIVQIVKEYVEIECLDEALKSRIYEELNRRSAA